MYLSKASKINKKIVSLINDVVFLDIETSGLDSKNSEILEIGAVKIDKNYNVSIFDTIIKNKSQIPPEIFSLCKNLNLDDFKKAPSLEEVKGEFLDFIEDKTIICHNKNFEKLFLNTYIGNIKNKFIDSMELAVILEPYHKEFNLDTLKKEITKDKSDEKHRALDDAIDTINVVNALILRFKNRLEDEDKLTLYPLTFDIDSYLNKYYLKNWNWSEYINNANYELKDETITIYEEKNKAKKENKKEEEIYEVLNKYSFRYEELLREEDIWPNKKGFIYEFRQGQYDLTKLIRETFNNLKHNISCIEAPTGIGKSVGYLLPAVIEARYSKKRIIISTATKELQVQLMEKDLPNIIQTLGLSGKVSYGYIKGKNNYICKNKFEEYKKEYKSENPTYKEILSIIIIENLIKDGKYGDIEEINYWALRHFKDLQNHLLKVSCDADLCKPKKCNQKCIYKNRIEELKDEDITVINHSLLAKWPYTEEKPLENIIVDEAHNLTEKGYDFFSNEIDYFSFVYFLKEIYPSEFSKTSTYYNRIKDRQRRKIKPIDKFYTEIQLDRDIKTKISRNIDFIFEKIYEILDFGITENYTSLSNYDLNWEINLQQDEKLGIIYKNKENIEVTYRPYTQMIKSSMENILMNIIQIKTIFDRNMDNDLLDKESDYYKYGKSKLKNLEEISMTLEKFLEYQEDDLFARIVTISKDFDSFIIKIVPLNLADLFRENILSGLSSGIFLSATLSVDNKMEYFTNSLGINEVSNNKKIINPIYDYKNKLKLVRVTDMGGYRGENFTKNISDNILNLVNATNSNVLSLFNSRKRQEETYNFLVDNLHKNNIELYMNKRGIKYLKNTENKRVVLGSKGCFEGVDIPGDGLVCVTLDKIPNLNPRDPLYFTIMKKFKKEYFQVNYPQMVIKVKQALGRILRSKYDYGIFVIFDMGNGYYTNKKLEQNLHGCMINEVKSKDIYTYIKNNIRQSRKKVIVDFMMDILKNIDKNSNQDNLEKYINEQIKQRLINANVKYYKNQNNKLLVTYYDIKYIVDIDKII